MGAVLRQLVMAGPVVAGVGPGPGDGRLQPPPEPPPPHNHCWPAGRRGGGDSVEGLSVLSCLPEGWRGLVGKEKESWRLLKVEEGVTTLQHTLRRLSISCVGGINGSQQERARGSLRCLGDKRGWSSYQSK